MDVPLGVPTAGYAGLLEVLDGPTTGRRVRGRPKMEPGLRPAHAGSLGPSLDRELIVWRDFACGSRNATIVAESGRRTANSTATPPI